MGSNQSGEKEEGSEPTVPVDSDLSYNVREGNYYDELIRSRGDATSDSTAAGCQQMSIFAFQISDVSDPSHGAMPGVM